MLLILEKLNFFAGNCTGKKCSFNESITNEISCIDSFDIFTAGTCYSLKNCKLFASFSLFHYIYLTIENTGAKRIIIDHACT